MLTRTELPIRDDGVRPPPPPAFSPHAEKHLLNSISFPLLPPFLPSQPLRILKRCVSLQSPRAAVDAPRPLPSFSSDVEVRHWKQSNYIRSRLADPCYWTLHFGHRSSFPVRESDVACIWLVRVSSCCILFHSG